VLVESIKWEISAGRSWISASSTGDVMEEWILGLDIKPDVCDVSAKCQTNLVYEIRGRFLVELGAMERKCRIEKVFVGD
jgi:hypothetical protein